MNKALLFVAVALLVASCSNPEKRSPPSELSHAAAPQYDSAPVETASAEPTPSPTPEPKKRIKKSKSGKRTSKKGKGR